MIFDVNLRATRATFVNDVSDKDKLNTHEACARFLEIFRRLFFQRDKVIFFEECAICRSSRARNVHFWNKENGHYHEELEHNPPHVKVWAAVADKQPFRSISCFYFSFTTVVFIFAVIWSC